ncbi:MAG TPA: hypothetical protein VJA94_21360 [Candidatus Angelobacter sp.]
MSKTRVIFAVGLALAIAAGFLFLSHQAHSIISAIGSAVWGS